MKKKKLFFSIHFARDFSFPESRPLFYAYTFHPSQCIHYQWNLASPILLGVRLVYVTNTLYVEVRFLSGCYIAKED